MLSLDTETGSGFLERDLDRPALHEPALRLELAERIAHQHPADRHDGVPAWRHAAVAEQEAGCLSEKGTRNNRSRRAF